MLCQTDVSHAGVAPPCAAFAEHGERLPYCGGAQISGGEPDGGTPNYDVVYMQFQRLTFN
jgi:hypothetical protein